MPVKLNAVAMSHVLAKKIKPADEKQLTARRLVLSSRKVPEAMRKYAEATIGTYRESGNDQKVVLCEERGEERFVPWHPCKIIELNAAECQQLLRVADLSKYGINGLQITSVSLEDYHADLDKLQLTGVRKIDFSGFFNRDIRNSTYNFVTSSAGTLRELLFPPDEILERLPQMNLDLLAMGYVPREEEKAKRLLSRFRLNRFLVDKTHRGRMRMCSTDRASLPSLIYWLQADEIHLRFTRPKIDLSETPARTNSLKTLRIFSEFAKVEDIDFADLLTKLVSLQLGKLELHMTHIFGADRHGGQFFDTTDRLLRVWEQDAATLHKVELALITTPVNLDVSLRCEYFYFLSDDAGGPPGFCLTHQAAEDGYGIEGKQVFERSLHLDGSSKVDYIAQLELCYQGRREPVLEDDGEDQDPTEGDDDVDLSSYDSETEGGSSVASVPSNATSDILSPGYDSDADSDPSSYSA